MVELPTQSLVIASIGVVSLGLGVWNHRKQTQAIRDSTNVLGTVTAIGIEERRRDTTTYYPNIAYEYEYFGESYTGDSLYPGSLGRGLNTRAKAQEALDGLEEDERVSLYVDKDDPSQSFVFQKTTTFRNAGAIVVGLFFIVFGIVVV